MITHEWLRRYTSAESVYVCERRVWQVGGLLVATDSKGAVCVEGAGGADLAAGERGDAKKDAWIRNMVEVVGEARRPDAVATTLGDLWAWLDRVEREVCPACAGAGVAPGYDPVTRCYTGPTCVCDDCDGRRWVWPWHDDDRDTVTLCGLQFDRNMLAWWLAAELGAPEAPVCYQVTPGRPGGADRLTLFGAGWKVITSPFAADSPGNRRGKTYRTYAPGAGGWWQARRQFAPDVHPGTDWFVEERGFEPGDFAAMWGVTTEGAAA